MITEINVSEQVISFFLFCLTGLTSGLIYDFFRLIRREIKSLRWTVITDIITAFTVFLFSLLSFYGINGLRLTVYHIIGYFLGGILYFSAVSSLILIPLRIFFNIFKKILNFLLYPARFSCIMIVRVCLFIYKPLKKLKKPAQKRISAIAEKLRFSLRRMKKI